MTRRLIRSVWCALALAATTSCVVATERSIEGQLYEDARALDTVSVQEPVPGDPGGPEMDPSDVEPGGAPPGPMLDIGTPDADGDCDLTGHWVMAQRTKLVGLGGAIVTIANNWHYWEIAQTDDQVLVSGGLNCGTDMRDVSATTVAEVTVPDAFNRAIRERASHAGRVGTVTDNGDTCLVDFTPHYVVVSLPDKYLDPTTTLPTEGPDVEDWDGDGKPGVTLVLNGLVSGEMHMVQRDRTRYFGERARGADRFGMAVESATEQVSLPCDGCVDDPGNDLSPDPEDHFLFMQRLPPGDIVRADDGATCENVVALANELLPETKLD